MGMRNGVGMLVEANAATTYTGQFKDELRHNHGLQKWPDDSSYDGQWSHGQRHGTGTMAIQVELVSHFITSGLFKTFRHSCAVFTVCQPGTYTSEHSSYSGRWAKNFKHGPGHQRYKNGDAALHPSWGPDTSRLRFCHIWPSRHPELRNTTVIGTMVKQAVLVSTTTQTARSSMVSGQLASATAVECTLREEMVAKSITSTGCSVCHSTPDTSPGMASSQSVLSWHQVPSRCVGSA